MLYSCSPRGSARPTRLTFLPLSGPLVMHLATWSRISFSADERSVESKSNFGALSGMVMLHALMMSCDTLTAGSFPWFVIGLALVVVGAGVASDAAFGGGCAPPHAGRSPPSATSNAATT